MSDLVQDASFQRTPSINLSSFARSNSDSVSDMGGLAQKAARSMSAQSLSRRINFIFKRLLDIAVSGSALVVLSPLFLVTIVLIRLESPGNAIFVQERWGRGKQKIRIYKFRSMFAHRCDRSGVQQTIVNDERVTRLGQFLRRTNLDELPQLINVFKGDLSLVGPRCHVVGMQAAGMQYEELVPEYHIRHFIRPGITGLAQVKGLRGPTTDANLAILRVENDLVYVSEMNVALDIKIIVLTCFREIVGGSGF